MKRLVIGILAHVDAGKTTLSEALLYNCGSIRRAGRVDHGDAFLDNFLLEKERGITIFSKQARLTLSDETEITLLDTPGHVDFGGEAERTLSVLDYAILVISASEGVQAHTSTLWQLLMRYRIPTFIFINKTDLPCPIKEVTMRALRESFGDGFIDFTYGREEFAEEIAMHDEGLLESFADGTLTENELKKEAADLISHRKIFPCFFGSALRFSGIDELIKAIETYTLPKKHYEKFGARVYKITRDDSGNRLTHMKITGGELRTKALISTGSGDEKADGIRIYSGSKFTAVDRAEPGQICAVLGLQSTYAGQGLGSELEAPKPLMQSVLTYRVIPTDGRDAVELYSFIRTLEEEDPALSSVWNESLKEIHIKVMGEVQLQVLKRVIFDRFGAKADFDQGNILYKETIEEPVYGFGHFEPLRHYAEVHLLLEPTEEGSGLSFETLCSENLLERNWQRLILTHLEEKKHIGVLTGSPITDMRITLMAGKAHKKHTEGGDFRQATYRAVRQGLMNAKSKILEPYYDFRLTVPEENIGRAISDVGLMNGSFSAPEIIGGGEMLLVGSAPVREMRSYAASVSAYTKGKGRLSLNFGGYRECLSPEQVIAEADYDPERDVNNSADSVFCSHGSGTIVKWYEAEAHMHIEDGYRKENGVFSDDQNAFGQVANVKSKPMSYEENVLMDKELISIFERTYGPIKARKLPPEKIIREYEAKKAQKQKKEKPSLPEFILVDGYNIIFAWEDLKKIAEDNLPLARKLLCDLLINFQGYRGCGLILVFDAYKVSGGRGSTEKLGGIHVVYTKEAETADAYIERVTLEMAKKYRVRVATSDNLEQMIVLGHGAERVPARVFHEEIKETLREIDEELQKINKNL
ncbi:MAG: translation factor GTPase family protein [Clostridia bacterium]|nr:translation factor GTPase family protein [Clostridia bacterium]